MSVDSETTCNHKHQFHHCNSDGTCMDDESCISLVPIFNHLEPAQMDEIMSLIRSLKFKRGENLYSPGDPANTLYIVSEGKIKIYRLSESGKEQLIRFLRPGDFTGELALFSDTVHEAYAEAIEDTSVCTITRSEFNELLLKYPSISLKVLSEFSHRLEQSEKQTTRFATERVETRIALFLIECMDKDSRSQIVELPMSKKDLASYLGTTPESISRKLTEIEEVGLIEQISNKKIKILDLDGLLNV
ncbi:MAG: Crp/Fnr family transcriptional regulator [Eubacteriales bacterium]|nr:Crp/Fnr family transcriptional regulator [Eubacteriales bacterium]MDD3198593.1 Crp/Fnr family transcriptional regulator [Eubacteriales bacterium]MDD3503636.1 Crp/Fnr family transcriptional regulator [Eubacteriales bacterium]MDD4683550.1 Crp/Fnr family transcriptional regulator [Eubacteriales bacterium]